MISDLSLDDYQFECIVCMRRVKCSDGVLCDNATDPHFVCSEDLEELVLDYSHMALDYALQTKHGKITCPHPGCNLPYSEGLLARNTSEKVFSVFMNATLRMYERSAFNYWQEQAETDVRYLVSALRHRTATLLSEQIRRSVAGTLHCPSCGLRPIDHAAGCTVDASSQLLSASAPPNDPANILPPPIPRACKTSPARTDASESSACDAESAWTLGPAPGSPPRSRSLSPTPNGSSEGSESGSHSSAWGGSVLRLHPGRSGRAR